MLLSSNHSMSRHIRTSMRASSVRASCQMASQQALKVSNIKLDEVDYIEAAHGTGTALGNPIEIKALAGVFSTSMNNLSSSSRLLSKSRDVAACSRCKLVWILWNDHTCCGSSGTSDMQEMRHC